MTGESAEIHALTEEVHGAKGAEFTSRGRPTAEASAELFAAMEREGREQRVETEKWNPGLGAEAEEEIFREDAIRRVEAGKAERRTKRRQREIGRKLKGIANEFAEAINRERKLGYPVVYTFKGRLLADAKRECKELLEEQREIEGASRLY